LWRVLQFKQRRHQFDVVGLREHIDGLDIDQRITLSSQPFGITGEGCRVSFSQLRYVPDALDDLRGGD